jgi:hypothetical protein
MEKLKEELRRKIMSEMGLTDEDLGKMSSVIRQVLEERIKSEIEKRVSSMSGDDGAKTSATSDSSASNDNAQANSSGTKTTKSTPSVLVAQEEASTAALSQTEEEKKNRSGTSCLVIPALAMPGGASLF